MLARNFRPLSNNKMSMVYLSYLTLGLTIPFVLPAHITQKKLNDCPYLKGVHLNKVKLRFYLLNSGKKSENNKNNIIMTILWQEARSYVASGRLELLKRSPKGTEKYRKHKQKLTGDISVDVCGKLGWDLQEIVELNTLRFPDPVQKLEAAFSSSNWFKTTVNDFPYDFQRGIHHLLVWSKISLPLYLENSETIQNDVYNKISNFLKYNLEVHYHLDSQDYLFFINYSNLQSVKAISHIHLLLHTDDSVADKILSNQLAPYIEY